MLSQTAEYALRAMVILARSGPTPVSTREISDATKVPQAYLAKILQGLIRAGLVRSQRGLKGGVCLKKPANQLTILEVVNAVDPIVRITSCPLGLRTHGTRLCALHRRLDRALALVEEAFSASTLAEVLSENPDVKPLCETQRPLQELKVIPRK